MEEEGNRANICVPPKNALLLIRCRSDPVKMAALANRFWESLVTKDDEDDDREEEQKPEGKEIEEDDDLERGSRHHHANLERESSILPDSLLLMMCKHKLSMEVSKETWVCSTDFIRCIPSSEKKVNKTNGRDHPPKKKATTTIDSNPPPHNILLQPPRSSIASSNHVLLLLSLGHPPK